MTEVAKQRLALPLCQQWRCGARRHTLAQACLSPSVFNLGFEPITSGWAFGQCSDLRRRSGRSNQNSIRDSCSIPRRQVVLVWATHSPRYRRKYFTCIRKRLDTAKIKFTEQQAIRRPASGAREGYSLTPMASTLTGRDRSPLSCARTAHGPYNTARTISSCTSMTITQPPSQPLEDIRATCSADSQIPQPRRWRQRHGGNATPLATGRRHLMSHKVFLKRDQELHCPLFSSPGLSVKLPKCNPVAVTTHTPHEDRKSHHNLQPLKKTALSRGIQNSQGINCKNDIPMMPLKIQRSTTRSSRRSFPETEFQAHSSRRSSAEAPQGLAHHSTTHLSRYSFPETGRPRSRK